MKTKKSKMIVTALLSVACLLTTAIGASSVSTSADESGTFDYPVSFSNVSVAPSNNGLTYSATDAVSVQTVATANRAEANYGWGAFAASDFSYTAVSSSSTTFNALVVDVSFPQNNFNYGLQISAIDKNGNKANLHAGYGWGAAMTNDTSKSFFRYYEADSKVGTAGTIEEAPLRAWVFTGIQATSENKVQTSAQATKTSFYGKYIFLVDNYSSVDFTNLDQIIFATAAANNKYGKWSIGNIYLANMKVPETITERPYVTGASDLTGLTTIWSPSAENAVPYIPAALNGVDDGYVSVSYVEDGFTLARKSAAMVSNYNALTIPFPSDLGTEKVSLTDLAYYFEVNNTSDKDIEYSLKVVDSEDTTNIWYTTALLENGEVYTTTDKASLAFNTEWKQNMVAADGTITEGTLGVIPAGFNGKITVTLSSDNFVAAKEGATFPEYVTTTMSMIFNTVSLDEGESISFAASDFGFQSASAVVAPPPAVKITDYDVANFDLNDTNPIDETATLFDFDGTSNGNYSFKVTLDEAVATNDTLGFLIQASNPTAYNRPFNILFYDEDGEVFRPSSAGDTINVIDNKTNVTTPEIKSGYQIRFIKNLEGTVVIPWTATQYVKTVDAEGTSSETVVNGKLNKIVAFSVEIWPDQAGDLEVIWIVGDYGFVNNDGSVSVTKNAYTDWTIAEAFEENKITLQSLPYCTLSYETNIDESVAALQIKLSAEKVYYPYGTAYINVVPNTGYIVESVTLNGVEVEKSGATTYPVENIESGEAKFYITFTAITEDDGNSSTNGGSTDSGTNSTQESGCGSTIDVSGVAMFAMALIAVGGVLTLKKKHD